MSDSIPLFPIEKKIIKHAILCTTGFLILLPIGALVARYLRTFTRSWFWFHAIWQFLVTAPIIFAGVALGRQSTIMLGEPHYNDPHKKTGLALLILYIVQLVVGLIIHFFKPAWFGGQRPPQNYFHAILGLAILALAAFQVHYGLYTEWPFRTGGLHKVPMSAKDAWLALIIIFWVLYVLGLALLPRQYKQERAARHAALHKDHSDTIQLSPSHDRS